jgi:lactate permease
LLLYQLQSATGSMDALARAIAYLCPDRDLQVLLLTLGLGPFIESASGFGVGTVVIIPILFAIGFDALPAALLGLLAQIAVPWGGLAVGIQLGAQLTKLDPGLLGMRTALLMAPLPFGFGLVALFMSGGKRALLHWWPAALLAGAALSAGEWFFSQLPGIELAGILASALVMLVLMGCGYVTGNRRDMSVPVASPDSNTTPLWQAVAPYLFLTAYLLVTRLIGPVQQWLQEVAVLSLPAVGLRLPLLYTPGFWVLLAALFAIPLLRIDGKGMREATARTWRQFSLSALAIICFLAMAEVMLFCGMTGVLGMAAAAPGHNYGWIAPWLGALGGWLTGSNAGGNAMFALLQRNASLRVALPLDWIMGAQNAAGSIVTMVAPARVILAATAAGLPGKEGHILRTLGPLILIAIAIITILLVMVI